MEDGEMGDSFHESSRGEQQQQQVKAVEDDDAALPGFRFHPTDEELVGFYLRRKVGKRPISIDLIKQIDIYKFDPWDLPKVSTGGDQEWYFYCLRGRKYRNSTRPNRVTDCGFWKATGIDKPIYSTTALAAGECIGLKKSLVYYIGSAGKGTKTDWMMHEFRLNDEVANSPNTKEAEIWTICRIFKRNKDCKKYTQIWKGSSSKRTATHSSSKSSSIESDTGNVNARFATASYSTETNKPLMDQLNSFAQAPSTTTSGIQTPNQITNELYQDGDWDDTVGWWTI